MGYRHRHTFWASPPSHSSHTVHHGKLAAALKKTKTLLYLFGSKRSRCSHAVTDCFSLQNEKVDGATKQWRERSDWRPRYKWSRSVNEMIMVMRRIPEGWPPRTWPPPNIYLMERNLHRFRIRRIGVGSNEIIQPQITHFRETFFTETNAAARKLTCRPDPFWIKFKSII